MVQEEEKRFTSILILSILIGIMGIIFLIIGIQSFWYTNTVNNAIQEQYQEYTPKIEEDFIQGYVKDALYIANQESTIGVLQGKVSQKALEPFEYFLLGNVAFMRGYIVNTKNKLVKEIAQMDSNKSSSLLEEREFSNKILSTKTVDVMHKEDMIIIGVPIIEKSHLLGAVILIFSVPLTKTDFIDKVTNKQTAELESDLFNTKEFRYTVTIIGGIFILISIGLLNVYYSVCKGYSLFDKVRRKQMIK